MARSKEAKRKLYHKENNKLPEPDVNQKIDELLSRRRGPREQKEEHWQHASKFVVEYKDEAGNLDSRWTYDLKKQPYGPISVENFGPEVQKKSRKS